MNRDDCRHEAERWLRQADADVKAARTSLNGGSFEWAAFQAQQGAEKAVKALWYYCGADPWGHSIVKLIDSFPQTDLSDKMKKLMPDAKKLDKLYIPTRYPNGLPDLIPADVYTHEDGLTAIDSAGTIIAFAQGHIEAKPA